MGRATSGRPLGRRSGEESTLTFVGVWARTGALEIYLNKKSIYISSSMFVQISVYDMCLELFLVKCMKRFPLRQTFHNQISFCLRANGLFSLSFVISKEYIILQGLLVNLIDRLVL